MSCYVLYISAFVLIFLFFFQAEDGIRDIGVTGVQTCALPISIVAEINDERIPLRIGESVLVGMHMRGVCKIWRASVRVRSEERRVGKECRTRWSAYHSKRTREDREKGK